MLASLLITSLLIYPKNCEGVMLVAVPDDFSTVNGAIAFVSSGGVVKIRGGVYSEYIYLTKSIMLIGEKNPKMLETLTIGEVGNVTIRGLSFEIIPPGTAYGIIVLNVDIAVFENLNFKGGGILIVNASNIILRNCSFMETPGPAIQIRGSSKNIVVENCMFNKTYTALSVRQGVDIVFRFNTVYAEDFSIKLFSGCVNTTIYMNNIFKGEVEDNGLNNKWCSEELKLGNFWGELSLEGDRDGDGIMDKPKNIGGTAQSIDKYPLAKPFKEYLKNKNQLGNILTVMITTAAVVAVAIIATFLYRRRYERIGRKQI
jgi:hypothetical protein